jgi:sporulation protein YlmC with PRC-barrel domain
MKRLTSGLIALALVAVLPAAGFAQTKKDRPAWSNTQGLHETGDIIGTKVEAPDGKDLGKVDALLIDPRDGKVSHAVIGLGGVFGIGQDKVVVPYSELKMTGHEPGKKARITVDQSALDQAPKYVKASERTSPSASPATSRPGTTPSSGGYSPSPSTDTRR